MVENIFEELDTHGEWYYDRKDATLYYFPLEDEDIRTAIFETPTLNSLIEIRGSASNPVRNITIENINLTHAKRTFMEHYEPLLRSDWTIYRGGAVFVEGAEKCVIRDCNINNLGGNAVFFSKYIRQCEITGCELTRIGASAICFVGDTSSVRSPSFEYSQFTPPEVMDFKYGTKNDNYPADCRVDDNLIHHIGLTEKQITGVELSMSRNITVSRNSIYATPRAGINISEGTWGGHVIEYNDVFDTVRETGDHGSFNSWGRDRFWHPNRQTMDSLLRNGYDRLILADAIETTVIRNNRFRCDRGWDIDLDDGSSNYHIYNNLCLNGGLKLREGFYRVVENNILINNTFHPHVWFPDNGVVFTRNIVLQPYHKIGSFDMSGYNIDYNIFTDSAALVTARNLGTDAHSVVAAVRFSKPEIGDFHVIDASNGAVFKTGFQNFDMKSFGVVSQRLKEKSLQPRMPTPVISYGENSSAIITWESIQLKNLETLGERSATGMDTERGVYVVAVAAHGNELRDYLKSNDVILNFNGKTVNNLQDLHRAAAIAKPKKAVQIIIFRDQQTITLSIPDGVIKNFVVMQQ
jgi:hypothetical protein